MDADATTPGATLMLPEILDLKAAGPLAAELAAARGQDIALDASGVRRVGAQCLQVLLSAQACWETDRARFKLVVASTEFTDGVSLLGAASLLPATNA